VQAQKVELKRYNVSFISKPQEVEIIKYSDGTVAGSVITRLTKERFSTKLLGKLWINLVGRNSEEIVDIDELSPQKAEIVYNLLQQTNINTITPCEAGEDCERHYLDSDAVVIEITQSNKTRKIYFEEIHPLSLKNKEIGKRGDAQEIITLLHNSLYLKTRFSCLFQRLPKGWYVYFRGASILYLSNSKTTNYSRESRCRFLELNQL